MFLESAESPAIVRKQLAANADLMCETASRLRALQPRMTFTCARGSSDHAATFAKYMFETRLRVPTVSQAPSIVSVYGGPPLDMRGAPFFVISQSGRSPDLLMSAKAVKEAGALVIAVTNHGDSPLAELADIVIPVHAGPEKSIAATKSYLATLSAITHLVAEWSNDNGLREALKTLDEALTVAWNADWSPAVELFAGASSMFVLGRGLTLAIAQEAALKFKETSGLHAEAFSLAEVAHGPMALVKPGFPLLVLPPQDEAKLGADALITKFAERGARIAIAGAGPAGVTVLPLQTGLHPAVSAIAMGQSFYKLVNTVALKRGYDPDKPPMLEKVTETR
ncbi:MAG: SIS domain-containing protein [Clostridia bacterium]|nr:SIS domain-containing protein [Deltaproteobacteria bacterium]